MIIVTYGLQVLKIVNNMFIVIGTAVLTVKPRHQLVAQNE
jgi:hypothetical protein